MARNTTEQVTKSKIVSAGLRQISFLMTLRMDMISGVILLNFLIV
jgi:hypothetical protein